MKIRASFVANSSSSSFLIAVNAEEYKHKALSIWAYDYNIKRTRKISLMPYLEAVFHDPDYETGTPINIITKDNLFSYARYIVDEYIPSDLNTSNYEDSKDILKNLQKGYGDSLSEEELKRIIKDIKDKDKNCLDVIDNYKKQALSLMIQYINDSIKEKRLSLDSISMESTNYCRELAYFYYDEEYGQNDEVFMWRIEDAIEQYYVYRPSYMTAVDLEKIDPKLCSFCTGVIDNIMSELELMMTRYFTQIYLMAHILYNPRKYGGDTIIVRASVSDGGGCDVNLQDDPIVHDHMIYDANKINNRKRDHIFIISRERC